MMQTEDAQKTSAGPATGGSNMRLDPQTARSILKNMLTIRRFEMSVQRLFRDGELPGFVHLSVGQESLPSAACAALANTDYISSTHRGHGHCIAKGADIDGMMAELFGRSTGTCGGRGGSMHIADVSLGILGANGIVGANLGIAAGAAFGRQLLSKNDIALAFTGDGAINTGLFHEVLNMAAIWKLPLIVLVEHNGWTEMSRSEELSAVPGAADRAAAFGVRSVRVSDDPEEVYFAVAEARERALAGEGPTVVECRTYRWHGHFEGDDQINRTKAEIDDECAKDAMKSYVERCRAEGVITEAEWSALSDEIDRQMEEAIAKARAAPLTVIDDSVRTSLAYA